MALLPRISAVCAICCAPAGRQPPAGTGFNLVCAQGKYDGGGGNVALSAVHIELDGNSAEGVLSYAMAGRRTLQGTLAAENVDLTPYVSTFHFLATNARDWDRAPFSIEGLADTDLDLRSFRSADYHWRHQRWDRTAVRGQHAQWAPERYDWRVAGV